jgi:hypothetical protein
MRSFFLTLGLVSGCATLPAAAITADRVATEHGEDVFGWDVARDETAQVVRWRECGSPTQCATTLHERSSETLRTIVPTGTTTLVEINGLSRSVEVSRLSFGPPPPNRPTTSTEIRARMLEAAPDPNP